VKKTKTKKLSKCSKLTSPRPSNKSLKKLELLLTSKLRKKSSERKLSVTRRKTPNFK
jgi:hypothetical protein